MRRFVFHLAIACLTFLVGCFIASSYRFLMISDESPRIEVKENDGTYLVEVASPQPELRVYSGMHACGPTANFHTYTASDGAKLSVSCFHMASAKRAALEVKKRLADAKEILEHQVDRHEDRVVRERIVLFNATGVVSLSVSGKSFCETTAPTLKHLQALERR